MPPDQGPIRTRREVLSLVASMMAVAGCSSGDTRSPPDESSSSKPSETPTLARVGKDTCTPGSATGTEKSSLAPVSTVTDTVTAPAKSTDGGRNTRTPSTPLPAFGTDDFSFDVSVLHGFCRENPARLEITFTNKSESTLTASGGPEHTLPFIDDDYVGMNQSNKPGLFLVPDNNAYFSWEDEEGNDISLSDIIPSSPTDGCWKLLIDWPPEGQKVQTAILHRFELPPGESITHQYSVYFLNTCTTGTFSFERTLGLLKGGDAGQVTQGFDLTVTETDIAVSTHEPSVS